MRNLVASFLVLGLLCSCSVLSLVNGPEEIGGVQIMSIDEVETTTGETVREVRGVVQKPLETNEEWILAITSINMQKRVDGINMLVLIFLPDEKWETGEPYVKARYKNKTLSSLTIDGTKVAVRHP